MKRALSRSNSEQLHSRHSSPKRRKLSSSGHRYSSHTVSQSPPTLSLTPEILPALLPQPPTPKNLEQAIKDWADNCDSCSETQMAPPQTPSVTSTDSSQRRASKLGYRRQRSQSPAKKTSTQYRSRNMADASVFVDHRSEPPSDVEEKLKQIFQVSSLDNIGQASPYQDSSSPSNIDKFAELAEKYYHKSRQMAKECAGEGQWKSYLLTGLVEPLQELWPDIIKLSASEKPWVSELRPTPPSFEDMLGPQSPPIPSKSHASSAEVLIPLPPPPGPTLPQTPVLSASSIAPSDLDDPNRVSIPKPDIALGFAHSSFARLQGKMLWNLQDKGRLFSEPHQSGIGLHFPFLVMEAKGLAIGSNMVGAQNQAAVGGACALTILRDLKHIAAIPQSGPRQFLFSVVTEGPIHELWVHYQVEDAYHMTVLRIWRTTIARDAGELTRTLCRILEWGVNDFRAGILEKLAALETMFRDRKFDNRE